MNRRSLLADLRPLQESRDFRRLWLGTALSAFGSQMTTFAVALQIFQITHSSAAVGAVGLAVAIPAIVVGLSAGVLTDSMDRRPLVLVTSSLLALVSAALAVQAFTIPRTLWLLYALVAVHGGVGAINNPARRTFMPRLLRRELVPAGAVLTTGAGYVALLGGPAVAGLITAAVGLRFCYVIDTLSFVAALYGIYRLPPMRPAGTAARRNVAAAIAGLRFIGRNPALRGALLADISATVLAMPIALFPAINAQRFGGSPRTLGLLSSAIAVGGLVGSTLSGPVGRIIRPGRAMLVAGALWGAALAGFGIVHSLPATLAFLAVAGVADTLAVVFRTTVVQLATPDAMRGRTSSAEYVAGAAFPQLGNFRAGLVASLTSARVSAFSGGLAAVVGSVLIALTMPAFVAYQHRAARSDDESNASSSDR